MSDCPPLPAGDYCIVELFGHVTLVGRYREVEQFGAKMMALEPLFNDTLLPVVFHGGAAIYRLTPCEAEIARQHQPRRPYQLPPAIKANVPPALLEAAQEEAVSRVYDVEIGEDDDEADADEYDSRL
jgi:hypothetical protein